MKRRQFLYHALAGLPLIGTSMTLTELNTILQPSFPSVKMPVLFLGHGNPMNAIEENQFVHGFRNTAADIETPKVILCISAHWETRGTKITAMKSPRTIHDFGGFPKALHEVQYPAPGDPEFAKRTKALVTSSTIHLDDQWGLDHGTWSVIKQMYPKANIPVVQLSLDTRKNPSQHYLLAKELTELRQKGVLIIGSGNLVHNLGMVNPNKLNANFAFDWAKEANEKMKQFILDGNHEALMNYSKQGKEFLLSIPTPEHYLPLLYALGLKAEDDKITFFNDEFIAGSLSMTSLKLG